MDNWLLILLLILVTVGGGFVQRVSGFGLGIFVMLFFPYLLPSYAMGAAVSCLLSVIGSGYNAVRYRKDIHVKTVLPLICAAAVTIPIAVHFSSSAPEALMKRLLGIVLIVLSVYFLFFSGKVRIRPTVGNGVIAGALGGTLNGLFSTGGPPVVLYMVHAAEDKAVYFASIQFYFALTNAYSSIARLVNGIITWEVMGWFAVCTIGWGIGNAIGVRVFERLDGDKLKKVIYIGMIVSGILMILR